MTPGKSIHAVVEVRRRLPIVDAPGLRTAKFRCVQASARHEELQKIEHHLQQVLEPVRMTADRAAWENGEPLQPRIDFSGLTLAGVGPAPLVAGEVLYHLRTALDYLVYNLAWLDTGSPQEGTAFPIVDPGKWGAKGRNRVKHLSPAHRDAIRAYQPSATCTWTRELRELSNQDKHQLVVEIAKEASGPLVLNADTVKPDRDDPTRIVIDVRSEPPQLVMDDGRPIVMVLGALIREVAAVVFGFQHEFGEADSYTVN